MDAKLIVDGKEIELNEFTKKVFNGIVAGAAMSLRGVEKDWSEIQIIITANDKRS